MESIWTPGSRRRREQPVVAVRASDDAPEVGRVWPMSIPAVAQVLEEGIDLSPEGGSKFARHSTRPTESPLSEWLQLQRGVGANRWGFFLRAETMHSFYTYLEENPSPRGDLPFHEMSHGESFLALLESRFDEPGFYCLDEPEAALSFQSTLTLIAVLQRIVDDGGQVLCATHSPVLAALPGARILEVGDWGIRPAEWNDLELVNHWRSFLQDPPRYLRHLLD
jgi:predicted ATPase